MQKFPRAKLADNGLRFGPGRPVVTPSIYKAEIITRYRQMEFDGLVDDADAMAETTIGERNARDPSRLDLLWTPYLSAACASSRCSICFGCCPHTPAWLR
jgi:phage tail sheath gpL-like